MGKPLPRSSFFPILYLIAAVLFTSCTRTPKILEPVEATSIAIIALTKFANTQAADTTPTVEQIFLSLDTPVDTPAPITMTPVSELSPITPSPQPTRMEAASPTATLVPLPQPTPTREIIYQDNFEATMGWYTFEGERYQMFYKQGAYHMVNNVLEAEVTSVRTQNHENIHLEVDAGRISGPSNAYYGLICRYQDDGNYYAFVVGSNGFYGIARKMGGVLQFISPPPTPSTAVKGEFSQNRIGATCNGHNLTLYSNGIMLFEIKDTMFSSGYVGLMVGTTSVTGVEVQFDNFMVSK